MYAIVVIDGNKRKVYYWFKYRGIRFWFYLIKNKLVLKKERIVSVIKF